MKFVLPSIVRQSAVHMVTAACVCAFVSCAPLAQVKLREAKWTASPGSSASSSWTSDFSRLHHAARKTSAASQLGEYLSIGETAKRRIDLNAQDEEALKAYNFAVARAVELAIQEGLTPESKPVTAQVHGKLTSLAWQAEKAQGHHPSLHEYVAADKIEIGGKYFNQRNVVSGIGAPFIAKSRRDSRKSEEATDAGRYLCVTAIIEFHQGKAVLEFHTPIKKPTVRLGGKTWTLAADFTAALAMHMKDHRPEKLGLVRLLRPEKYQHTALLTPMQAYDPKRIPVIFVHGLDSTPATWAPMINALRMDEKIRERYQFLVFSYPSGYAYPYSAALLRKELDSMRAHHPDHLSTVLIGHSMGSLVSRLMLTDVGDNLWMSYFGKSPDQIDTRRASAQALRDSMVFHSRKDVSRVIFICGPHRGSALAVNPVVRLAAKLIRAPKLIRDLRETLLSIATADTAGLRIQTLPNSIDTLSPQNRFVKEIQKYPIDPRVPYHSIIGDRGRGNTPNSTDGVVPYWSSHLEGARSEKIVPHGHGAHQSPEAIAEVKRILTESQ